MNMKQKNTEMEDLVRMTNKFYKTETFDKNHNHFGGKIYLSDFNTDYRGKKSTNGSSIASRIASDFRREEELKRVQ